MWYCQKEVDKRDRVNWALAGYSVNPGHTREPPMYDADMQKLEESGEEQE